MSRRYLVVLLIVFLLVVAAVLLKDKASDQPVAVFSFEPIRTLYEDAGGVEKVRPLFVDGEVLVKFRRRVSVGEIAGLRIAQGAEEVYVSRFSGIRR